MANSKAGIPPWLIGITVLTLSVTAGFAMNLLGSSTNGSISVPMAAVVNQAATTTTVVLQPKSVTSVPAPPVVGSGSSETTSSLGASVSASTSTSVTSADRVTEQPNSSTSPTEVQKRTISSVPEQTVEVITPSFPISQNSQVVVADRDGDGAPSSSTTTLSAPSQGSGGGSDS